MNSTNVDWPLIFAALFPWACVVVAALMTPRLTRPDLFFAVTVNPSFRVSPAGAEILCQYNRLVFIVALLGLLPLACFKLSRSLVLIGLLGPIAVEIAGCFIAFFVARRRTIPHHVAPSTEREADLAPRNVTLPGGWMAQAGPLLFLAAICFYLWINWDRIPVRMPIHWGVGGRPDGWAAKSPGSVFGFTVIAVLICVLLAGLCYAVMRGVRRIHPGGQAGLREARFVRGISFFLLVMEYWLALVMGLFSLAALRPNPQAPLAAFWPILLGQTLVVGAIFLLAYRSGQGGWRLRTAAENEKVAGNSTPVGDRTPDECWRLGVVYFNRNDPALFVEKRFGVGWTLNFANPKAWFVLGAILCFVLATLSLSLIMSHAGSR